MQAPQFSLVLATYGRAEDIGRFVNALLAQTQSDYELIVVDQNADERVAPQLAAAVAAGKPVLHLRQAEANLSAARNLGLRAARGRWVAFPDDDCWYAPALLERASAALQQGLDGVVASWFELEAAIPSARAQRLRLEDWRRLRGGDASSITLFLDRERVLQAGGFDERLGVGQYFGAAEETDLLLSLLSAGCRLERDSALVVHHPFNPVRLSPRRTAVARSRGTGALYAKHRLAAWICWRGLLAPLLHALTGRIAWAQALAIVQGRWQGWRRWPHAGDAS